MSKNTFMVAALTAVAALALQSCAIPQPALDEANTSAHLMMQMQQQVDKLDATQQAIAKERIASIRDQRARMMQYDSSFDDFTRLMAAGGMDKQAALYDTLTKLADARAKDAVAQDASLAALDDQLAKILTAVPSTSQAIAVAEKDMAALGVQRSSKERAAFLKSYVQTVQADVKADQAKAASAAASAASAAASSPTQAAPAQVHLATP